MGWWSQDWVGLTLSAVLGLIFGSVSNALIYRIPRKVPFWKGRSQCPHCAKTLAPIDLIPILSFVFLKGRCRQCQAPIGLRYLCVELLMVLLFVAVYWVGRSQGASVGMWARDLALVFWLITITFIDLEFYLIPDVLSLSGWLLGLLTAGLDPAMGYLNAGIGSGFGFGLFYLISWAYFKRTGRIGLGGGDIKFLGLLGAFLGISGVLTTVLVSSVLGSVIGLWIGWKNRGEAGMGGALGTSIPFGPFLVVGALYFRLLGGQLWLPFTIPM